MKGSIIAYQTKADKTDKKTNTQTEQFGSRHTMGIWVSNLPEVYFNFQA